MPRKPLQVSVVYSGCKQPAGKAMASRDEAWHRVPLYDMLKDRVQGEQVHHGQDANDPMTLIALYSQTAFADVCIHFLEFMLKYRDQPDAPQLVDAQCNTGAHRATTFSMTITEMLNELVDGHGNRVFNAQSFSLLWYTRSAAIETQIDSAVEWITRDNPHIMPGGGARDRSQLFGYKVTAQRAAAQATFDTLWDWVDAANATMAQERTPKARSRSRRPVAKVRAQKSLSMTPMTPTKLRAQASDSNDECAQPETPAVEPEPPVEPPWRTSQVVPEPPVEPPWANASSGSDMSKCWFSVLNEYGVDDSSQHGLYALAQSGPWGRRAAFGIMSKLFKKEIAGDHIKNPSAFIWSAVRSKWDECDWA
jgi:hypothetical protein